MNEAARRARGRPQARAILVLAGRRALNHPLILCVPAFALFAVFVLYPLLLGFRISLTDWNGFSQSFRYVGFDNYAKLFVDERIHTAFRNTLYYGVGSTILQNVWGLAYALFLNRAFAGRNAVRAAVYLPVMLSGLIMGYLWYFLVQYDGGALNDILIAFGREPIDWLADGARAVHLIVFVTSLQFVGQAMVIYLAGLQAIPVMYYEAAAIDGASAWSRFLHVTLPLLVPAIITNVILKLIGGLQLFDLVVALTNGGPGYRTHSLSTMINFLYFESQNAGYSAALGTMLFLFILVVTLVTHSLLRTKEVER